MVGQKRTNPFRRMSGTVRPASCRRAKQPNSKNAVVKPVMVFVFVSKMTPMKPSLQGFTGFGQACTATATAWRNPVGAWRSGTENREGRD